ncbi:hypothetical protein D3C78_1296800 [compost metagenome]
MDAISSIVKQLPSNSSAFLCSPSPIFMEARGAPPAPIRAANAEINIMIGKDIPIADKASVPPSSILPRNIRSTTLYMALIS